MILFGVCSKCKLEKPASDFSRNSDPITWNNHPLAYKCKKCVNLYNKQRSLLSEQQKLEMKEERSRAAYMRATGIFCRWVEEGLPPFSTVGMQLGVSRERARQVLKNGARIIQRDKGNPYYEIAGAFYWQGMDAARAINQQHSGGSAYEHE